MNGKIHKSILIVKRAGEILNLPLLINQIGSMINMLQDGEYVLAITKRTKRRTLASNRLFWLWMACIEMETGTPKEDAHDYYCSLFLRRHVMFNGVEKEVISGTSTLNTVQFSDFLKKIQADADTELGITLPDPEAAYWEEFERYYSQFV